MLHNPVYCFCFHCWKVVDAFSIQTPVSRLLLVLFLYIKSILMEGIPTSSILLLEMSFKLPFQLSISSSVFFVLFNLYNRSIAIGHPFAATGGRLVLSAANELRRYNNPSSQFSADISLEKTLIPCYLQKRSASGIALNLCSRRSGWSCDPSAPRRIGVFFSIQLFSA